MNAIKTTVYKGKTYMLAAATFLTGLVQWASGDVAFIDMMTNVQVDGQPLYTMITGLAMATFRHALDKIGVK